MKKLNKVLSMILVLAMVLSMIPMVVSAETSDSTQFVLMSTADVHGKVWNKNLLNDTSVSNSLLNVATAVKEIRGEYGENTLLVDNGDLYQGTPVASYHISQYSQGQVYSINPVTLAMEYIDYDTYTLGNHEFNYPWETMVDFYDYLETKGISCSCANLYFEATGERVFAPYYTKTLTLAGQEFTIGVIGIENTDCTRWDVPDNYPGIIFASPENKELDVAYEVNKVLAEMAADGVECDFIVLNYHAGLGSDDEELDYGKNTENQILRTIKRTSGLDVVVAGHDHSSTYSHNTYTDKDGNEVMVVNAGSTSLTKSVFNVSWDEANGFTVTTEKSENLNLASYAVDQELYEIIKPYAEAANTYVNTSVGSLVGEWDGSNKNLYTVQSDTVDLINRAQVWAGKTYLTEKYGTVEAINAKLREIYGENTAKQLEGDTIEVDLSSTSVVTTGPARAGELSMKGIYTFYKYDNSLYLLTMTGQEIKDLLEYNAAERLNAKVSNGTVNYQTIGDDFSNPIFFGLNFVYDMAQAKGERVIIDGFSNGKSFELDKTYVVAMNNYHLGNASNDELSKYATTDALWSQTDDLGGGYVQDIIANYVGTLTERDGGVYATKNAAKNGETASAWSLTYSGDTSSVILPDETAYIATEVAAPVDGDQVIFYYPAGVTTVAGTKAAGAKFAALDANINGDKLFALEGSGVFTVGVSDQGVTFKTEEGYLSCTGSGDLSYQAEANANSYWEVIPTEGGVFIESKAHENVYMEHYYGFTTYESDNPNDIYIFKLYSVEDVAALVDGEALAAGDHVVIYYNNNGSLISSVPNGGKLTEVASEAATTESGSILAVVDGAAIFEVEVNAEGKLLFHAPEGYLTSGTTGNSLTLTAEATEYSLWDLQKTEGGYYIHSVNANYNGNYNQYVEYYQGFTTYGLSGSSNTALYTFNFYKADVADEEEEEEPTVIEAPAITASNNQKTGKVKLTWNAVEGAASYKIYRATSKNGAYKLMYTTSNTTYTNTLATAGKYYYYYVVAVAADGTESEASNTVGRTCNVATPVVTASNVAKTGKVQLTWDAVEGAVSYKIYRAASKNGKYSLMYTTANTTYINTKAEAGVTYYYKVVAVAAKAAANSPASAVVSRTCDLPQVKGVTGKLNLLGRPKLTWNKVEGAVAYKVYRAETETGKYKLMRTTTGTSYTNTKNIDGRSYYYYVVAVCENTWGNSAPSNIVKLIVNKNAPEDIVILYTNDVHTYIDNPLSYDVIAGVKKELEKRYDNVLLMDAGDHAQGTAYGSMDKGETVVALMNAAGYDVATLGNHEFDYGMEGAMNIIEWADYTYVSSNFYHEKNGVAGKSVLPAYKLFECGKETVAIVGVTTPESFTKSTPAYFQDDNGNYIYGIAGGADGKALYNAVQTAINDAKAAGATKIIGLGHLGDDPSSAPWTSAETISNVHGLTAFIDGHSHSAVEGRVVADKKGSDVVLTQTGEYFDHIGMMIIDGETGVITTDFIEYTETADGYALVSDLYTGASWVSDETTAAVKEAWIAEIDNQLNTVIGNANVTLGNYNAEGKRLVRSQETNAGDFCADALYYLFDNMGLDVDVAIMNGGGIRNKSVTGELTYKVAKEIHTFGNVACLQTVSGPQLLDALEWGARVAGTGEECGGFLQVAGITYDIDAEWPSSVQMDDKGVWIGAPTGGYRVSNVKVYNKETQTYEPLELTASYNMAGYNYTLRDLGDGFNMFDGAVNVLDYVMEDYMVLANYIKGFEDGVVDATNSPLAAKYSNMMLDYGTLAGSGRITIG